jgi:predicted RNA binding protein with dsRBD fold (UPF0201 family)
LNFVVDFLLLGMSRKKTAPEVQETATVAPPAPHYRSLPDLQVVNGKLSQDQAEKIRILEEALDIKRTSVFGTTILSDFEERLREMSISDLQRMMSQAGLGRDDNPTRMRMKLRQAFRAQNEQGKFAHLQESSFQIDPNNPKHQKLLKILKEGF